MEKVIFELMPKQAEALVDQLVERLGPKAKLRLVQKLQRQMRRAQWQPLVQKMRSRFSQNPLSSREIRRLCEKVRQERFDRASGR